MIVDYHMHLRGISEGPAEPIDHTVDAVERFVEAARAAGVDEIAFTEHVYYFRETRDLWELPYQLERCRYGLDAYCGAVLEGKRRGLPVKLALEVDYVPGREGELRDLLAPYPWDFLLGSVHWLAGEPVFERSAMWAQHPVGEVWKRYFAALRGLANSGLVDVLAHPDYVKILGLRPVDQDVARRHEETANAIAAAGVAIEVSTAALRRAVGELYPSADFLAACRARAIPVTTASDAHAAKDVGRDLDQALAALCEAGYRTVTVFAERRARQETLG